jgi:hypothetical protein
MMLEFTQQLLLKFQASRNYNFRLITKAKICGNNKSELFQYYSQFGYWVTLQSGPGQVSRTMTLIDSCV